ncbi:MAG TPA: type II toxin-antitoxin system mRNA interferase toxin, RelE/StbE family [Candidatus Paceibacterota bacterium]|nr:type II toxin-antitoxin system mRNA interferase toxin, RelE/StbE family [Candidatus Paceibacterota bacterium]HMP19207.1 type II toxin-antitoxin system mRNA interferase toxin, RelE/StbE family [Candidatus Paceibacterota bacterium]HMP85351.1 type II toxin-antitoxin system mRNA interferase toxin, RelE/StbE family [Candidatus Paceibacterota bacterium]
MQIRFHRKFKKALQKQSPKIQKKFFEKMEIFVNDQFHYSLNNHALTGQFSGWRSFDVTGDIRVHYGEIGEVIVLMNIGSHSQLYW